jgi:dihydroorotate dehydrogenase (NAD+) catalytic subunit
VKPVALYMVYAVAGAVTVPIVGLGGIMSADDAVEFLLAGATAVGLGTALMANPTAWRDVVRGLEAWQVQEGVRRLDEVVGAANAAFKGKPAR